MDMYIYVWKEGEGGREGGRTGVVARVVVMDGGSQW
jgi:hypothetical protein